MLNNIWIPPAFILLIGSIAVPFLKGKVRNAYLLALPIIALADTMIMGLSGTGSFFMFSYIDKQIILARVDKLSLIFGYVFCIAAFIGTLYSIHLKKKSENIAAFLYAGSALGVVFAGDLLSLFIFWEIMALGSGYIIWNRGTKKSQEAGFRYYTVHFLGGLLLLSGILLYASKTGSITFDLMNLKTNGLAAWLILAGFAVNCAIPPLSAWLSDAYPEATITGTIFLSAFTTKTAVYVLIRGFRGTEILIWWGALMAFYGVIYAFLSTDIRRVLAYHIISTVGFMVAAIGIGTELAINGAVAYAVAGIIYTCLLFMGAGGVMTSTGRSEMSELGGIYKKMPWVFTLYMIGAFSISGFPLLPSFISKSMILSAAEESKLTWIWLVLTISSIGTWLNTGLKLPWFTWLGKDKPEIEVSESPRNMLYAMGITAAFCLLIGFFPHIFYRMLPYETEYLPYTYSHVVWTMQYLLLTALAFFVILKYLNVKPKTILDTDWLYRRPKKAFVAISAGTSSFNNWLEAQTVKIPSLLGKTKKPLSTTINYSSNFLFAVWVDFWLFTPTTKLFEQEVEKAEEEIPGLIKYLLKPFNSIIDFIDNLSKTIATIASSFDEKVLDKTSREVATNVLFDIEEFSPKGNRIAFIISMFEKYIVVSMTDGLACLIWFFGERARRVQTGLVQTYALITIFIVSAIIVVLSTMSALH